MPTRILLVLMLVKAQAKRIMSLKEPHLKMSKSHTDERSRIHINDPPDVIAEKIRLALTDSIQGISFDPATRPGLSNLLQLLSCFDKDARTAEELAQEYCNQTMRDLKERLTTALSDGLHDVRIQYKRLLDSENSHFLEDIAQVGAIQAQQKARETSMQIQEAVGLR